jgi:hypothetical protein
MSRKNIWQFLIALVVVAVLASAITVALAGPSTQEEPLRSEQGSPASRQPSAPDDAAVVSSEQERPASEPGKPIAQPSSASAPLGPQPDEEGYTGDHIPADSASIPPSEEGLPQGAPDWEGLSTEPQPDEDAFYEQDAASPQWSTPHYLHVAGTALRPRDSRVTWRYGGNGCVYVADTSDLLNIHVSLPEGSRVEYLRIYYYDTVVENSHAWLTRYDDGGIYADVLYVGSTGSAGYSTALSYQSNHIVDNYSYSYILNWRADAASQGLQLCGLRLSYRLPD